MVPPAKDELPPLAEPELELLQAARTPGIVTAPAAAASPLSADRLLSWRSSMEDVCFIATPCGSAEPPAGDTQLTAHPTERKFIAVSQDITEICQDLLTRYLRGDGTALGCQHDRDR